MPELSTTLTRAIDAMDGSVGEIGAAQAMPPELYTSTELFEMEREAIFGRSWIYLCHESEIANPGDYQAVTVLNEPLLITRDQHGYVHVLSAVCQHRGYVIAETCGSERSLRCPYHSWTYGLDGELLSAPAMEPAYQLDDLRATVRLPPFRSEVWHGLVFVNFDPDAAPLVSTVSRLDEEVAPYRIEDMVVAESVTLDNLPFNWKNMQENALEEYHTTYVHRGYHENAPADRVVHGEFAAGDDAVYRHAGLIIKGGEDVPGRPTFPVIADLPEANHWFFLFASVLPAMFAAIRPDGLKLFRILPQSADRMTLTISFLFPPTTLELDEFPKLMERQRELITLLDQPDIESNTRIFRGLHSRHAPRGPYSTQEATLPQFNSWLLARYRAYLGSPT
jgi:phenylpropionate dioxygenase-like ring-hydroxylating dioxygenase large terminal subunit